MTNEEKLEQLKKQVAELEGEVKKEKDKKDGKFDSLDELLKSKDFNECENEAMRANTVLRSVKIEKSAITGKYKIINKGSVVAVCDHPFKAGMVASALEIFDRTPAHVLEAVASISEM